MVYHSRPSYRFEFHGGLSRRGEVERIGTTVDGEQVHRIHYWLDDLSLAASAGRPMPAPVADMIDVSAAVYIADRLALREVEGDPRSPGDRWHRRIHVVVPMRHPDQWQRPEVIACLKELLALLTDDDWDFAFVGRSSSPRPSEAQASYRQAVDSNFAFALHSGGLDSLIGLIDLVRSQHEAAIVPVSVVTNPRVRTAAESIIQELRREITASGTQLLPAQLRIGISGIGRSRDDREPTQRARAMLFLAAGIGTAVIAGVDHLRVCENGIGAISLPMTADHWGARATRAMHPKTLLLLSSLATLVLGRPVSIENTGLFVTKGELARRLAEDRFMAAARHTVSCDRATYVGDGEACGKCTSCILRRVALVAANLDTDVDGQAMKYRTDWFDPRTAWNSESVIQLMAMRDQVERLRDVTKDGGTFAALEGAFPDLFDVVDLARAFDLASGKVAYRLLRLYKAYVIEFDTFVARIDRPGWGRRAKVTELSRTFGEAAAG